jgi:hypothetical protein
VEGYANRVEPRELLALVRDGAGVSHVFSTRRPVTPTTPPPTTATPTTPTTETAVAPDQAPAPR